MNPTQAHPRVVGPEEGKRIQIGGFGTVYKVPGSDAADGAAAVIEHTLAPGALAAPLHRHTHEDEISLVLEGEITVQQGEEVTTAGPGCYVFKPRGVFHTFWNAGSQTARLVEIIAPAGFERYFEELQRIIPADGPPDFGAIIALGARYGMEFDMGSVPVLMERYGLRLG
jgi:quercetin dioxygenase-like cupin family protein